ncbi:SagB/ThcOx family dehydrogenase [Actinomadura decatromicini]|uniref:SagB/ThcOx family dehydrogenase n=1 Tax=Actinomadura decatromicini TaxID=2604572 RepID=A0A5D3FQW2_9ACTN|nr:SagB/ThcOx family dehydrogenase [Actinomadura decatromicini]TYK50613.1 SagB/ThcOx family dehydrogenase [Actinomadura decatromicini]
MAETAEPVGLIEALGYGVRDVPLPAFAEGAAFALVAARHAAGRLELSGDPVPMLALTAGHDAADAAWRLAARAVDLRQRRPGHGVGAGPSRAAAVRAAVCDAVARRPPPATARRLTGWEDAVPPPLHPSFDGRLDCHLFDAPDGLPLVGAVLRQGGGATAREIRALGCALTPAGAVRAALDGVLAKIASGGWTAPAEPVEVTAETTLDGTVAEGELGDRVKAKVRTVLDDERGAVIQCSLLEERPGELGPWAEHDVAGCTAPAEVPLACPPSRVRLSRLFHENSKIRAGHRTLPPVDIDRLAPTVRQALARPYRDYGRTETEYALPTEQQKQALLPLDVAVRRRRSAAPMAASALPAADLARVLDLSAGITGFARTSGGTRLPLRATPTAGGLCSCDLFVLTRRVDGLRQGVHYFHPGRRVLQLVRSDFAFAEVAAHTGYPGRVADAAAIAVFAGAFRRNQWKYWERGYRMVLLECGHLAQSVVVAAAALGLVAHPLIGFVDDYFNRLLGLDGTDDAVLYLVLLGKAAS